MSIYQGLTRLFTQAFAGALLALIPTVEAIAQQDKPFLDLDFVSVQNCDFLPTLTTLGTEEIRSMAMYVPQTYQEFKDLQLFLEDIYLCKFNLQEKGLIGRLDQATLGKLNDLDSFSQEFILLAADPNISTLDQESQLRSGMIPFGDYIRTSFLEISDKGVIQFRDNVGLTPPQGFVFIKIFHKYGENLQAPSQVLEWLSQEGIQGLSINDRYIIAVFEPGGDNLTQAGRMDQLRKTISHELIHAYVKSSTSPDIVGQLPIWFHEGVAIHFSGSGGNAVWMDHYGNIQQVFDLEDYESYRLAFKYLNAKLGREQFNNLIKLAIETGDTNAILESVGAKSFDELESSARQWSMRNTIFLRILIGAPMVLFFLWLVMPSAVLESIKARFHFHNSQEGFGAH